MIGLMWYDNSPLAQKIANAAMHYILNYGVEANVAHVNPANYDPAVKVDGIEIVADPYILPNHIWVGVKDG